MLVVHSGERVGNELGAARKKLLDQVESEQFIQKNFHLVTRVREQIVRMRCVHRLLPFIEIR